MPFSRRRRGRGRGERCGGEEAEQEAAEGAQEGAEEAEIDWRGRWRDRAIHGGGGASLADTPTLLICLARPLSFPVGTLVGAGWGCVHALDKPRPGLSRWSISSGRRPAGTSIRCSTWVAFKRLDTAIPAQHGAFLSLLPASICLSSSPSVPPCLPASLSVLLPPTSLAALLPLGAAAAGRGRESKSEASRVH